LGHIALGTCPFLVQHKEAQTARESQLDLEEVICLVGQTAPPTLAVGPIQTAGQVHGARVRGSDEVWLVAWRAEGRAPS
jgi:hypothetical protein